MNRIHFFKNFPNNKYNCHICLSKFDSSRDISCFNLSINGVRIEPAMDREPWRHKIPWFFFRENRVYSASLILLLKFYTEEVLPIITLNVKTKLFLWRVICSQRLISELNLVNRYLETRQALLDAVRTDKCALTLCATGQGSRDRGEAVNMVGKGN